MSRDGRGSGVGERPRRASKGRLVRLTRILAAVTLLAGVVAGSWEGYRRLVRMSYFRVAEVYVEGNLQVATDEVVASLGLPPDTSLLEVDLPTLSRRVLQNPWIKEASVRRRLPLALTIQVVERVPEAVFIADRRYLLSADGVILTDLDATTCRRCRPCGRRRRGASGPATAS